MSDTEKRLYGLEGAENMYRSIESCYECVIADDYDAGVQVVVEEWTVADNRRFLPTADRVIEFVLESAYEDEVVEDWMDDAEVRARDPKVMLAFDRALRLLAGNLTFWMAFKFVAHHVVVTGEHPTVDGEPMYIKAGGSDV